jgi:SPOR domain
MQTLKYIYKTMKIVILLLTILCSSHLVALAQDETMQDTMVYALLIKDTRLDALDTRPAALLAATEAAVKKVETPKNATPVYNPIQAGKKVVTGSITQRQGFRVQIYNGADRNLAMKIKTEFNRAYPATRSYMNYSVPNFKIKVGDFETKKEAGAFLKRIQAIVPQAFLVPDVVTVKNILVQ